MLSWPLWSMVTTLSSLFKGVTLLPCDILGKHGELAIRLTVLEDMEVRVNKVINSTWMLANFRHSK
ncbi:hypothetical protein BDP81DRAFT_436994 [Colletotrichum phormii]|uniref:Uncharacterized protein n=1 Tax=Colletotrichum phormii TaxID=359342 RepID=A0AAI9ZI61_9PEZI|nr:uncharacterized protein BDP81DRAFT_436994 [Colletotrichum phormii]KAK1625032.1 hypothetical protein BDP81DRAFT_436994 [Colletotrichum phormii]